MCPLVPIRRRVIAVLVSRSPMVDAAGEVCGVIGYYDCGQCEAHRRAEVQLLLSFVPADQLDRLADGLAVLREEFNA